MKAVDKSSDDEVMTIFHIGVVDHGGQRRDVGPTRIDHAHLVSERLGLLRGAKITDEAGSRGCGPGR